MAHLHCVYDGDTHFEISPVTREIENTTGKTVIMQNDHNSERFTFEIPRYVDGHDMSLCNRVEVHYNNIDASTKDANKDVYEVEDLQLSPDSDDVVICSWLISGNATKYAGSLNFVLRFACLTGSTIDYQWLTDIYREITVSESINNTQNVAEDNTDILAQWKAELEERYIVIDKKIRDSALLKDDVRQTLGNSENLVISQKTLSDFIADCNFEFESVELTVETKHYNIDGTLNDDTSRVHAVYNVQEGDAFKLSTKIQKWGLAGYIFFDRDNNVISYGLEGRSQAQDITDYELICPEGASKLIVQSTNSYYPPILKKGIRNYSAKWYTKAEIDEMLNNEEEVVNILEKTRLLARVRADDNTVYTDNDKVLLF